MKLFIAIILLTATFFVPLTSMGGNKCRIKYQHIYFKWGARNHIVVDNYRTLGNNIPAGTSGAMGDKCKKLLSGFLRRSDTSMKKWAQDKGVKYENLKLDYWRCKETLRKLYFPQSQGMGEEQTA